MAARVTTEAAQRVLFRLAQMNGLSAPCEEEEQHHASFLLWHSTDCSRHPRGSNTGTGGSEADFHMLSLPWSRGFTLINYAYPIKPLLTELFL